MKKFLLFLVVSFSALCGMGGPSDQLANAIEGAKTENVFRLIYQSGAEIKQEHLDLSYMMLEQLSRRMTDNERVLRDMQRDYFDGGYGLANQELPGGLTVERLRHRLPRLEDRIINIMLRYPCLDNEPGLLYGSVFGCNNEYFIGIDEIVALRKLLKTFIFNGIGR